MSQLFNTPFSALTELHRDLSQIFGDRLPARATDSASADWTPHVDITESADGFEVVADVPGVDPAAVDVSLDHQVLTVKGERNTEVENEERGFRRRERFSGSFIRQFTLPESADADAITAKVVNGVLVVRIPRREPKKVQTISVQS